MCADGSKVLYPLRELEFLANNLNEIVAACCEILEAGLHSYNGKPTAN